MKSWREFALARPDLAEPGRAFLYGVGVGLAYLAATRPDGGPRVHPMCPLVDDAGLFGFIVPSPKQRDLRRDGRYALHSFPTDDNEDAFSCMGVARLVDEAGQRNKLAAQFVAERSSLGVPSPDDADLLFEFALDSCLLTRTTGHGDPHPVHRVWRDR